MKVKPLKIKIKEPTPSAADRLYAKHQAIRKEKGLPDPSEYKKKLSDMRKEQAELEEQLYKKARFVSGPAKKPFKSNTMASPVNEGENKQVEGGDPCWKGYQMVGKKMKNGREVPNCVPVKEDTNEPIESHATLTRKAQIVKDAFKSKKDKQNAKDEASDKFQSEPELSSAIHKT